LHHLKSSLARPEWLCHPARLVDDGVARGIDEIGVGTTLPHNFQRLRKSGGQASHRTPRRFRRKASHQVRGRSVVTLKNEPLPSEGKGQKFESSRARHDFNDLTKEPLIVAEAPRKQSTGSNRTVCGTPVGTSN
jgi:hypothetical protein